MTEDLAACLPPTLRGPSTTITPIATGLSGARVFRVDAAGRPFVLKIAAGDDWQRRIDLLRAVSAAGIAPRVVHVDEERHAVVTEYVGDRPFFAAYADPRTRAGVLARLGTTLRRLHDVPVPPGAQAPDLRALLGGLWSTLAPGYAVPAFARQAIERALSEAPPPADRAPVTSHNDLNPTNIVLHGDDVLLLDWDTAGVNDPTYDLGVAAMFLRMDDATIRQLLAAYEGAPVAEVPARLHYHRRFAAVLAGTMFLHLARQTGRPAGAGDETLETTLSTAECYQRMRTGDVNVATPDGKWAFGLALVKQSTSL